MYKLSGIPKCTVCIFTFSSWDQERAGSSRGRVHTALVTGLQHVLMLISHIFVEIQYIFTTFYIET